MPRRRRIAHCWGLQACPLTHCLPHTGGYAPTADVQKLVFGDRKVKPGDADKAAAKVTFKKCLKRGRNSGILMVRRTAELQAAFPPRGVLCLSDAVDVHLLHSQVFAEGVSYADRVKVLDAFLDSHPGFDLDAPCSCTEERFTIMHWAAYKGSASVMRQLKRKGASVDSKTYKSRCNPILLALKEEEPRGVVSAMVRPEPRCCFYGLLPVYAVFVAPVCLPRRSVRTETPRTATAKTCGPPNLPRSGQTFCSACTWTSTKSS